MRPLTKEEKIATEKGIKKLKSDVEDAKMALDYAKAKQIFNKAKWDFEDIAGPIERKMTISKTNESIDGFENEIKEKQNIVKEMERQLKEGVEVKTPLGV